MRIATAVVLVLLLTALPAGAVDFLGIELCQGSTDTAVDIPIGSSLILESVEIGDHGGLVMLLSARSGNVMDHVDDLMTGLTGQRGAGDGDTLEWTGGHLTGVAQKVAKKYAALAVTSDDECSGSLPVPVAPTPAPEADAPIAPAAATPTPDPAPVPVPVPVSEPVPDPAPAPAATPDFQVIGAIDHEAADQTWIDVMGVVANHTGTGYRLATFDVSFFAADGSLICVDTISVSVLKSGQERAFRDSIRCPDYDPDEVAEIKLQFAGGL